VIYPKPAIVGGPSADREYHTVLDFVCYLDVGAAIAVHGHSLAVFAHSDEE